MDNYNELIPSAAVSSAIKEYLSLPIYAKQGGYLHQADKHWTERKHAYGMFYMQLTIEGNGVLEYLGETYDLVTGDIFFVNADNYHYYKTKANSHWKYCYLNLYGELCNVFYDLFHKECFTILKVQDLDQCINMFDSVYEKIQANQYVHSLEASNIICSFLHEMALNCINENKTRLDLLEIEHIVNYITSNFTENISVSGLSDKFHFSPEHLIRKFKLIFGCTPYQFIIDLRLKHAKQLLLNSNISLDNIASMCGFGSTDNMVYHFKNKENTSPQKYRVEGIDIIKL